jgi:multidrug resistance efflux pump
MTANPIILEKRPAPEQMRQATARDIVTPQPPRPVHPNKPPLRSSIPSHRRRALLILLVVGLVLTAWWGSGYLFAYTDDAFLTSDIVSITPEVSGPVEAVHVADNQWVKRGTSLFTIDPVPFRLQLEQAQQQEAQAQAQLPIDQAELDNLFAQEQSTAAAARLATTNLGRDTPLGQSGWISAQALDRSRAAQEEGAAQQHAAQAALQKATETLRLHQVAVAAAHATRLLAEWRLSRTNVVAPVDGDVTHLILQPGDMASPDQAAVAIVDAHAWHVVANYKEYYLRHLVPGHTAWVWLDTHPWHLYRARIQGIAHGISREQGSEGLVPYVSPTVDWIRLQRRIPVRLTLLDTPGDEQLFMGADARVLVVY